MHEVVQAVRLDAKETAQVAALPTVFSYAQARDAGLSRRRVYWLRDHGHIEALSRGTYRRTDIAIETDPDLIEIATRAPQATLCLTSVLARHGLTDTIPSCVDIAIPRGTRRPPTAAPVRWHVFDPATFGIGRYTLSLTEVDLIGFYGPERSIIDAFRLRHREGVDLANEALKRWLRQRESSPSELMRMAEHFPKAQPALRTALEILL